MHIEPALLNPACQTLESVEIIMSSEGFALGPIFFPFSSSSQTLKHFVTKWSMTVCCFLGVIVLCTSYTEMCRTCLCLTSAFYRARLQYLHLPEASACLLIKQQDLWLSVELLDWHFYFYSWDLLYSLEVFWFFWVKIENLTATFQKQSWKRASTFYTPKPRYSEFFAKNNICQAI